MNEYDEIVKKRLIKVINAEDIKTQRNELKQIAQELILSGLSQEGFFNNAVFMGGTSLRLFHGLTRYSEDLDFRFIDFDSNFDWNKYKDKLNEYVHIFGGNLKFNNEDAGKNTVRVNIANDKLIENIHKKKLQIYNGLKIKLVITKLLVLLWILVTKKLNL